MKEDLKQQRKRSSEERKYPRSANKKGRPAAHFTALLHTSLLRFLFILVSETFACSHHKLDINWRVGNCSLIPWFIVGS